MEFLFGLQCFNMKVWLPSWMISILNPTLGSNFLARFSFPEALLISKKLCIIEDALHHSSNMLPHHLVSYVSQHGGVDSFRDL